ncbi:MAG: NADH-quinone oxidoreductase subunit NuoG [Chthonomonas sp.]|nr:NADH-quinone oxidoreductase subunit NuoG [Chthonomonas sp.]
MHGHKTFDSSALPRALTERPRILVQPLESMAAVAETRLVTITINDVELQVPKGELIVESVKRLGLEIPIFCYHARMKPVGMCRMCLVEVGFKQPDGSVRKMPKPQAGCTLPADNNMVIYTDTEMVHRDRKGVLEFLLVNHPLDCPICDRGGECPLQNNTIFYGPSTTRFTELKRHLPKAYPLSQYVTLDLERCIQCGRCVRFTEEISGDAQLAFRFRGSNMQPSTFQLLDFDSKFSGNVIEICPVGALTSAKYRFRARPWDLETSPFNCLECSNHCSVWFDHRAGKFVRMNGRTNEAVNEEWTCDKGKFGQDWINDSNRSVKVMVRKGDAFAESTWSEAYDQIIAAFSGGHCAALIGGKQSNESLFLLGKLFRDGFKSNHLDSRWTRHLTDDALKLAPDTIASLEHKKTILILGTSLADELPMVFLRARKAWFKNGTQVLNVTAKANEADAFATQSLRYDEDHEADVVAGIRLALEGAADDAFALVARRAQVSAADFRAIAKELGPDTAIITSRSIFNVGDAGDVLDGLQAIARKTGCTFNCYAVNGNDAGAEALGLIGGQGSLNTREILEACVNYRVKALWLFDCNPFDLYPDHHLVNDALESVAFLVVQGSNSSSLTPYASVVLPSAAPAEQDGSYVNMEGRLQRGKGMLQAPGDAKPSWRIFSELLLRTAGGTPYFNPSEILQAIGQEVPSFAGVGDGELLKSAVAGGVTA